MRVTLNKVAKVTGYSVAAISQVLNNHPNAQTLRSETREKILQAVRDLGYKRNDNAVQTRTGICKTVALISDFKTFDYDICASIILSGVLLRASQEGFGVKVYETSNLEQNFDEILRYGIEYVLCFSFNKEDQRRIGDFCHRHELSLCYLQEGVGHDFPVVYSDDRNGMYRLVGYLYQKGHRRVALVNPAGDTIFAGERRLGFLDGMRAMKLPIEDRFLSCRCDLNDNRRDIGAMLRLPPDERPTAFACADDSRALLVENEALCLGIMIPGECAVTGFGNTISSRLYVPASTITQPFQQIGMIGLSTVIGKPDNRYEHSSHLYLLPTDFIERESTMHSITTNKASRQAAGK